ARAIQSVTPTPRLVINDRVDIALAVGADGVHVGQDDMAIEDVRAVAGRRLVVGVSTHDLDQARVAQAAGADYLGCGPTFPSGTKSFQEFPGPEFLKTVAKELEVPAFAIGGINDENVQSVVESGFQRVAVSGVVHQADSPTQIVGALKQQLLADR
ncbi:MAG: thiamine phosphate synthase, partial [Planctomycetota bacterium]